MKVTFSPDLFLCVSSLFLWSSLHACSPLLPHLQAVVVGENIIWGAGGSAGPPFPPAGLLQYTERDAVVVGCGGGAETVEPHFGGG